ncbi:protein INCA1 isoform X2 [Erythrolamprus reginae]|uniref:protein INCA1 isoform X2 n=1 Tax=Erythrolamprus reginae TaxID=121349 RepID=UPI00396CA290
MDGGARAEEGGGATLGPFVKQSKMVSRDQAEVDPSSDAHGVPDFWDRLVQQPSCLWMGEYQEEAPPAPAPGWAAQRPPGDEGGPWPWEAAPTPRSLPSPKELCQKKRKGPKQRGLRGRLPGLSVLYHLEEVKRRQSNIDKQKAAQERPPLPQLCPQSVGAVGGPVPAFLLSPAWTPEPFARPFLRRAPRDADQLPPQWDPNLSFTQGSPPAFYALAAHHHHHRSPHGGSPLLRPEE